MRKASPTTEMTNVLDHLRRSLPPPEAGDLTDGQLLERFLANRDEAAFASLVQRHGRLVMGVCRRVLGNIHDSEDGFQAAFLILSRKAGSVVKRETVASWLYTVAFRTALEARAVIGRRRMKETPMRDLPEPEARPEEERDWQPLLDRELCRLPKKYQMPVILCDLEGRTRKEAAGRLGLPEGTLSSRLARARRMLAARLSRNGLTLSGGALAVYLAQSTASAKVPLSLVWSTSKAATLVASGQMAGISATTAILMKGAMKSMFLAKLKATVGAVLVVAILGVGGFAYQAAVVPTKTDAAPPENLTELEALRKENELLKINLNVTLEKIKAQEAELRKFRGEVRKTKTAKDEEHIIDMKAQEDLIRNATQKLYEKSMDAEELARYIRFVERLANDPSAEVEAALKALKGASDNDARKKAEEALEKAVKKLMEKARFTDKPGK